MNTITRLIIMAFLVEAFWETLKMIWKEGKLQIDRVGALVIGLTVAFTLNIDLFIAMGLDPSIKIVGTIFTGIIISRGGNFIHDLFSMLEDWGGSK